VGFTPFLNRRVAPVNGGTLVAVARLTINPRKDITMQTNSKFFIVCLCCFALTLLSGCGGGGSSAEALTPAERAYADKFFAEHGKDALLSFLLGGYGNDFPAPDISDIKDISTAKRVLRGLELRHCKYLVSKGADVNAKDNGDRYCEGYTPLHYAAQNGHPELAKFLVSKGANVNAKDDGGDAPLDYAKGMAEQCLACEDENYRYFKEVVDYLSGLK